MARLIIGLILMICCLFIAMPSGGYARKLQSEKPWFHYICQENEKFAEIDVYRHQIMGPPNQTVYVVAQASIVANSSTMFGLVQVGDNLITTEPHPNSEKLGRAQMILSVSGLEAPSEITNMIFVFTSGKYNGSTISIVGRNQWTDLEREYPIVGGTGVFLFARGYVTGIRYSSVDGNRYIILKQTFHVSYVDGSKSC